MGFLQEGSARKFVKTGKLMDEIVQSVIDDPKMVSDLADEMADQLEDVLEDDGGLKDRILSAVGKDKDFRKRVAQKLTAKLQ